MVSLLYGALKRVRHGMRRFVLHPNPSSPPVRMSDAIRKALSLPQSILSRPKDSLDLIAEIQIDDDQSTLPTSYQLFHMEGRPLPCLLESDLISEDDWLSSQKNYPYYYGVFRRLTKPDRKTRLLEIGVRTGYVGVVFALSCRGPSFYMGVDPNFYLPQGLELASQSLRILRNKLSGFDFALIEGSSWDPHIQSTIAYGGPFDLIHIDGDHTLTGKLIDLDLGRRLIADSGMVLVDDYDHHPIVAEAIKRALALGWFQEFAYLPSMRGMAILRSHATANHR